MWRALAVVLLLWPALALAQTGTPQTKSSLNTEQDTNFADNNSNAITPLILRQTVADMIASWQQAPKVNAQVGTTYTVVADDYGKLLTFSNAAVTTVTVPQATGAFATFSFFACNQGNVTVNLTPTTSNINGVATYALARQQCTLAVSDGANWQTLTIPSGGSASGGVKAPTSQTFTTGTNATYTTPAGATWIEITMVGGGAGGAGGGTNLPAGTAGNPTCWNTSGTACTSPVYQAGGGAAAVGANFSSGFGGTVSGSGTCNRASGGGAGGPSPIYFSSASPGSVGGNSMYGGGGAGVTNAAGGAGAANTGGGGGGGGNNGAATLPNGAGGGSGASCYVLIVSPAATYTYTVGATAAGGTAGTNGFAGGAGAAGQILVIEHYGP